MKSQQSEVLVPFLVSSALAGALVLVGCAPTAPATNQPCNSDADCGDSERCDDGLCAVVSVVEPDPVPEGAPEPEPTPEPTPIEPDAGSPEPAIDAGTDAGNPAPEDDAGPTPEPSPSVDSGSPEPPVDAGSPDVPVDAGEPDPPVDAGSPGPTDAFSTPWWDPSYDVRARYRGLNAKSTSSLNDHLLLIRAGPSDFGLPSFTVEPNAFRATDDQGVELGVDVERIRADEALVWVRADLVPKTNSQAFFLYLRTSTPPDAPQGSAFADSVARAFHFEKTSNQSGVTLTRDSVRGLDATIPTPNALTPAIIGQGLDLSFGPVVMRAAGMSPIINGTSGTLSFWMNHSVTALDSVVVFGNLGDGVGNPRQSCFTLSMLGGALSANAYDETGTLVGEALSEAGDVAGWTRIAVEWSPDNIRLRTDTSSISVETTAPWTVLDRQDFTFHAEEVVIDEVRVHTGVLGYFSAVQSRAAVFDAFLFHETAPRPAVQAERATTDAIADPLVRYAFDEGDGTAAVDQSAFTPSVDLNVEVGTVDWGDGSLALVESAFLTTVADTSRVTTAIQASNEITVEAWLQSDHPFQDGPARIFTFSSDTSNRAFTLGQAGADYVLRLNTNENDTNGSGFGQGPIGTGTSSSSLGLTHVVFSRDATGVARLFVDGQLAQEVPWPGDFTSWLPDNSIAVGNEFDTTQRPWTGNIFSVSLYDRAFDAADAQASFNAGSP